MVYIAKTIIFHQLGISYLCNELAVSCLVIFEPCRQKRKVCHLKLSKQVAVDVTGPKDFFGDHGKGKKLKNALIIGYQYHKTTKLTNSFGFK